MDIGWGWGWGSHSQTLVNFCTTIDSIDRKGKKESNRLKASWLILCKGLSYETFKIQKQRQRPATTILGLTSCSIYIYTSNITSFELIYLAFLHWNSDI